MNNDKVRDRINEGKKINKYEGWEMLPSYVYNPQTKELKPFDKLNPPVFTKIPLKK